jgi:hypothetical protein
MSVTLGNHVENPAHDALLRTYIVGFVLKREVIVVRIAAVNISGEVGNSFFYVIYSVYAEFKLIPICGLHP